jgi:hypothetical protein
MNKARTPEPTRNLKGRVQPDGRAERAQRINEEHER